MCDHSPNREAAMTVLRRDPAGKPTVWCDPCIAWLIDLLNPPEFHSPRTIASCCGHGARPGSVIFADGTWLSIQHGESVDGTWVLTPPFLSHLSGRMG